VKFGKHMSRVGKKPILIPDGVEIKVEGQRVVVRGPKGELEKSFLPEVDVIIEGKELKVVPKEAKREPRAIWGLTRALIANLVLGVTQGFKKELEIEGVGYKASIEGEVLVLNVGFSHSVKIDIPKGITVSVEKNVISVSGIDKEAVGQIAANIRKVRPVEPYKGKGIKYVGEQVRRKVGKKAISSSG